MLGISSSELEGLSADSFPPFAYAPLPEIRHIRLLRLFPGRLEDTLSCSLFVAKLEEAPSYEAHSYVWGLPNRGSYTLRCGYGVLQITTNRHDALRNMRQNSEERIVWEDAVCIYLDRSRMIGPKGGSVNNRTER